MSYKQVNLRNITKTSHLLNTSHFYICMLREVHESDLVSLWNRVYQRRLAKQQRNVLCADTTNHNSVLKRSHGFINHLIALCTFLSRRYLSSNVLSNQRRAERFRVLFNVACCSSQHEKSNLRERNDNVKSAYS